MKKFLEVVRMFARALRISFEFCFRNAAVDTSLRLVLSVVASLLSYAAVVLVGKLINSVQHTGKTTIAEFWSSDVAKVLYALIGVYLCIEVSKVVNWFVSARWSQRARNRNSMELHAHRATLDIAVKESKLFDDVEKRIEELPGSWSTRVSFAQEALQMFRGVCVFVTFGSALAHFSVWYVACLACAATLFCFVEFRSVNRFWKLTLELVLHNKKRRSLESAFTGDTTFLQAKTFGQHTPLLGIIADALQHTYNRYVDERTRTLFEEVAARSIACLLYGAVLIYIVWNHVHEGRGIGELTVVLAAANRFYENLSDFVEMIAKQWNAARGVVMIQDEFFGLQPLVKTQNPVHPQFAAAPRICFKNVWFTYPEQHEAVLRDVNLTIEPGTVVAIVGKSGNGKSTLAHLLMRHYDPQSGDVTVDGYNLRQIEPSVWVDTIGALHQDYAIAPRTVGEEIASSRLGDPINNGRVQEAIRFADFASVIDTKECGIDTQIGTAFGGTSFSGGERQRLALARVYYRGTPVMVFDEPDASLDPDSAQRVMDNIFALKSAGVTVIIITHHVARTQQCDQVVVMHGGEVIEEGDPRELLMRPGHYARLVEADQKRLRR